MAKTYVFAIGGTGARVMRSLTMLMASGLPGVDHTTEICPIIIDYDLDNGDKSRAINSMNKYCKVREYISKGNDANDGFFSGKIVKLPFVDNFQWRFGVEDDTTQTFSEYIGYRKLDMVTPSTQELVGSLYDASNDAEYTELEINMKVGFQGNPNIGSVVFNKLKEDREFKEFVTHFNPDDDKVVIVGSLFGGTGASGIPELITAMHNPDAEDKLKKANIAAIMVLPYFVVSKGDKEDISVKSVIFNSKTKAALNYYEKSGLNALINRIYYVGDKSATVVKPHLGAEDQKNAAHPVEMIAAMAIAHFADKKTVIEKKDYKVAIKNFYKFGAGTDIVDGITFNNFVGKYEENSFVRDVMHNMIGFSFIMKYFYDEIVNNGTSKRFDHVQYYKEMKLNEFSNKKLNSMPETPNALQDFCAALYSFYCMELSENIPNDDGYMQWIKEMHLRDGYHGKHALKFFNFNCKDIKDFVQECPLYKEEKSFMSRTTTKRTLIDYKETFDSCLNNALTDRKHFEAGKGVVGNLEKYPWVLIDIMKICSEELRKFTPELEEKFKSLP